MNPLVIVAGIPTALALFGVIRKNRMIFLLGYFLYALIVVPNEFITYNATGEVAHLAYTFLWGVQAVLAFPNRLNYDGTKVFKSFGVKFFLSLSAINLFGVFLIQAMPASLELTETTKSIAAAYHGILAVLPLVGVFLMTTDRIPVKAND
ncbi:MAG: hypothetical protein CL845_08840 [Crocinitomicaceae bacterium]|nr:hypothetical protein [Crocinitomicaceae bacterium]|tara:strand:- start:1246 stop:1695 length:450 start_codon:yes stop_codon:yes gene_type:complete